MKLISLIFHLVLDICALFPALNCSYGCRFGETNPHRGYCFCKSGFQLDFDNSTCKGLYWKVIFLYLNIREIINIYVSL